MPQTPFSSGAPYISNSNFLQCYAQDLVAGLLRSVPSAPPPSYLAMIDPANPAAKKLAFHTGIGAGEIESWCAKARRYTPLDLAALTGVSQEMLWKLNAARGFWSLAQTLKPITARMEDVPFAKESAEILKMLGDGEMIFGYQETMDAGLPVVQPPQQAALVTPNTLGHVAPRLFPGSQFNLRQVGGGD